MMALGLDFDPTGAAFASTLRFVPAPKQGFQIGPRHLIGGLEALSSSARTMCPAKMPALSGQETLPPQELQEALWRQFFADSEEWWDNRRSKPSPRHPDFRHKQSKLPLWLNNRHKPDWVDAQLALMDAGLKTTIDTGCTSHHSFGVVAATESHSELGHCRKLCEDGLMSEAVEALDLLVQQESHVPNSLFCRLLKRCILDKDLALGKRIHALTVTGGYEGDAYLATQLIGLYASHGRLEEAMQVFTKTSAPNAYNWTSIIFAYARHGEAAEAAEAIRLYRKMFKTTTVKPDDRLFSAVLKACTVAKDLAAGKEVHAHILASATTPDRFVQAGLVNMYAKCGSLEEARRLFDKLPHRDMVTWTAMIAGYAQQGMGREAVNLYRCTQSEGFTPDRVTYACLLQACASVGLGALREGKQLHAEIKKRGVHEDVILGGSLVNMYTKCGSLGDARKLFDSLPERNIVAWNAMIAGYAQQGMAQEALGLYSSMQQESLTPDSVTFVCLLQACATVGLGALREGKQLHAQLERRGLKEDAVLGGSLVDMYAKCGSLEDARLVFDKLTNKHVVTWTSMISAYAKQGMGQEALILYKSMQQEGLTPPDCITYTCLLQACASAGVEALDEGKQLHENIQERGMQEDVVLGGSLVNMYAKCGSLEDARKLFDKLPQRNIVVWNAMVAGYAQQGRGQEALSLYSSMQQEGLAANAVTYVCLLQACANVGVGALYEGKRVHAQIKAQSLEQDVAIGCGLVNMYAKCGSLQEAQIVFDKISDRHVAPWTVMIAGYAQQGLGQEALALYKRMQQDGFTPSDCVTYVCLLQACASVGVGALSEGKQLHAQIKKLGMEKDVVVGGSLVNMHAKCGSLEDARNLFDSLEERNIVAWNAMIAGYAQRGMGQDTLSLYKTMQQEDVTPDSVTYVCLLQACAAVAALPIGEQLHAEIDERGVQASGLVGAALVNMYAKCGSMYDSQRVFDTLPERSIETWSSLISGYARQGDTQVVFDLLDRMILEGIHPDGITLLSVLTVCSHAGLVDKGRDYFKAMTNDYGIDATMDHYICMVDLLGRAGHLDEALEVAKTMPFPPNDVVWHTLLGACRKWKSVRIGQQAFEGALSVNDTDAAAFVLMSNIYSSSQMWEAAQEMQAKRKKLEAWKKPGQSWWTDMSGVVHTFIAGDKNHSESKSIYARLEQLIPKLKKEGYVPRLESSLSDLPDDGKQAELRVHSEKLAIAYALNKTAEGTTIRIVKNLRVCEDCHTATAYISKVENRTIICRDASRFHVYKDGKCSCGDYW